MDFKGKHYNIEGSFNVRDLGGLPTVGGGQTMPGRFIRAGSLFGLTDAGRQALLDLGARCILDLRSHLEVEQRPDPIMNDAAFDWHHIPMMDYYHSNLAAGVGISGYPETMEEMYIEILGRVPQVFAGIFKLFADPTHKCILFHCTAGKDRTGAVAMILLSLAGVREDIIAKDYGRSAGLLPAFTPPKDAPKVPEYLITSPPKLATTVLKHLKENYGGTRQYLIKAGTLPEDIDAAVKKLIAPEI